MITLDGIDYEVLSPTDNALNAIAYVNQFCADKQVKNAKGELVQIEITNANPLYLLFFGLGYLMSIIQQLLYSCGCMFNIQASSPRQLLNLATIAKMHRKDATRTTISGMVYARATADCVVTMEHSITAVVGEIAIQFFPAFDLTVPKNSASPIVFIADREGSFSIPAGSITRFDETPEGFDKLTTEAAIPGKPAETVNELRDRLLRKSVSSTQLDRCADAIMNLPGVVLCSIYFNYSTEKPILVGDTQLLPRRALLFVQGFSQDIAETYFQYLACLTQPEDTGRSIQQDYITSAGQHIPVYIIPPIMMPVYIHIFFNTVIAETEIVSVEEVILRLAATQKIGQALTAANIIDAVQTLNLKAEVQGAELCLEAEGEYTYIISPQPFELVQFIRTNINSFVPDEDGNMVPARPEEEEEQPEEPDPEGGEGGTEEPDPEGGEGGTEEPDPEGGEGGTEEPDPEGGEVT